VCSVRPYDCWTWTLFLRTLPKLIKAKQVKKSETTLGLVSIERLQRVTFTLKNTIANHSIMVGVFDELEVLLDVFDDETTARRAIDHGRFDACLDRV